MVVFRSDWCGSSSTAPTTSYGARGPATPSPLASPPSAPGWDWRRHLEVGDLADIFPGPVYDVKRRGPEAAKLAYQGASAAVFDGSRNQDLLAEAQEQREQRPKSRRLKVLPLHQVIDHEGEAR